MSMKKNGGPAFPRPFSDNGGDTHERWESAQEGMSLRDYFAGQIIGGMMADGSSFATVMKLTKATTEQSHALTAAKVAYSIADAMLSARDGSS